MYNNNESKKLKMIFTLKRLTGIKKKRIEFQELGWKQENVRHKFQSSTASSFSSTCLNQNGWNACPLPT